VTRVLRDVDLPFVLLEKPEIVIPLRAQFRFLERAARETGDACFGARLGQLVRMKELSKFGAWVCSAETLLQAIERGHAGLNVMLQTSTGLSLQRRGSLVRWSIDFLEPETDGRLHNELLGISYMIDTVRTYVGKRWCPEVVMTTLSAGAPRAGLEQVFGTNISVGHAVTSFEFDQALLNCGRAGSSCARLEVNAPVEPAVPEQDDALAMIAAVTDLALYEGYPRVDWVAAKLDISSRSLQRLLEQQGTSFRRLKEDVLLRRAKSLLGDRGASITEIAFDLGYRDLAHFTRAFRRWTGRSPTEWREFARGSPASLL
ncbi:MAG: AraC family transcriptional regulator ligand-binding domain-containing protein, partial [Hyphomicrobium sp.]